MSIPVAWLEICAHTIRHQLALVTAAINSNSDTGCAVLFENDSDIVMTAGVAGSRTTCNEILKLVSLTNTLFEEGGPSGSADENAHSSSSPADATGAAMAGEG